MYANLPFDNPQHVWNVKCIIFVSWSRTCEKQSRWRTQTRLHDCICFVLTGFPVTALTNTTHAPTRPAMFTGQHAARLFAIIVFFVMCHDSQVALTYVCVHKCMPSNINAVCKLDTWKQTHFQTDLLTHFQTDLLTHLHLHNYTDTYTRIMARIGRSRH